MEKKVKKLKVRLHETEDRVLEIRTPFIKLDAALKFSDIAQTGGHAKILVENGEILVNGEPCAMRGKKLTEGDTFEYGRLRYTVKQLHEDQ